MRRQHLALEAETIALIEAEIVNMALEGIAQQALRAAHPTLGLGGPTIGWVHAAFRLMRAFAEPDYPRAIATPTLVIASGADRVVDTRSVERFATRLRAGHLIVIDGARHEAMFERDTFRQLFFKAFDAFARGDEAEPPAFTAPLRAAT